MIHDIKTLTVVYDQACGFCVRCQQRMAKPGIAGLARRAFAAISTKRHALSAFMAMKDDDLHNELQAKPEVPHCDNALDALRDARKQVAIEGGG